MRRFELHRDEDVSGVSGTGVVAEGVAFSGDGPVALRWLSEWPTSVVFHDRGVESLEAVHGHSGRTRIVWLDDVAPAFGQVGWLGADLSGEEVEEFDSADEAEQFVADEQLFDGQVLREFDGRFYIVDPGQWVLRYEDENRHLLNPLPVYVDAAALAAYTDGRKS